MSEDFNKAVAIMAMCLTRPEKREQKADRQPEYAELYKEKRTAIGDLDEGAVAELAEKLERYVYISDWYDESLDAAGQIMKDSLGEGGDFIHFIDTFYKDLSRGNFARFLEIVTSWFPKEYQYYEEEPIPGTRYYRWSSPASQWVFSDDGQDWLSWESRAAAHAIGSDVPLAAVPATASSDSTNTVGKEAVGLPGKATGGQSELSIADAASLVENIAKELSTNDIHAVVRSLREMLDEGSTDRDGR